METQFASIAAHENDRPSRPEVDDINVNWLVWDTEYWRRIVERLRRERAASNNPRDPADR
jgi:hypothetical protein